MECCGIYDDCVARGLYTDGREAGFGGAGPVEEVRGRVVACEGGRVGATGEAGVNGWGVNAEGRDGGSPRLLGSAVRAPDLAGVVGIDAFVVAIVSRSFIALTASFSPGSKSTYLCATDRLPCEARISTNSIYLSYNAFKSPPAIPFVCLNTVTFSTNPCNARA